ncbi:hypothetical protein DE146DRAFT_648985 [Phaeosphaeria sp. MPI-PUGE-AT-0046c]|nr:hypothetical protein DE146DRAFT_648985 [Phaeosphaeria sp. MPI-PUGE-AT-0046c]
MFFILRVPCFTFAPFVFMSNDRLLITNANHNSIPGTCGGLWDNLKRFADCIGVGNNAFCRQEENGDLRWHFQNGASCNAGMVEATWYEATKNEYGSIDCGV